MIELEKKWLLKGSPELTPADFEVVNAEIFVQSYLNKNERLRAISDFVDESIPTYYQYFKKEKIGVGQSLETHRDIEKDEYDQLHSQTIKELKKARISARHLATGLVYEFDDIPFAPPRLPLLLLEVEFQDIYKDMTEVDANFVLPECIQKYVLADVTGLDSCSNWSLAEEL